MRNHIRRSHGKHKNSVITMAATQDEGRLVHEKIGCFRYEAEDLVLHVELMLSNFPWGHDFKSNILLLFHIVGQPDG